MERLESRSKPRFAHEVRNPSRIPSKTWLFNPESFRLRVRFCRPTGRKKPVTLALTLGLPNPSVWILLERPRRQNRSLRGSRIDRRIVSVDTRADTSKPMYGGSLHPSEVELIRALDLPSHAGLEFVSLKKFCTRFCR